MRWWSPAWSELGEEDTYLTSCVLGNGPTRNFTPLEEYRKIFPEVYACNAVGREDPEGSLVDHLVVMDDGMLEEMRDHPRLLRVPEKMRWQPSDLYGPNPPRANAGMLAMYYAARDGRMSAGGGQTYLFCFGFDFILDDESLRLANVYSGTPNYENAPTLADCIGRAHFLAQFAACHPSTQIILCFPDARSRGYVRPSAGDDYPNNVFVSDSSSILEYFSANL